MLYFNCISTGSTANCYLLSDGKETLILDMGVKYKKLLSNIGDLDSVVGAVLTHSHADHDAINGKQRTSELLNQIGIKVLSPNNCEVYKKYKLGSYEIVPVNSVHNVICYGYLIKIGSELVYFATDTSQLQRFANQQIDYFIVECNYCNLICERIMLDSSTNIAHLQSIFNYHHGLDSLVDYFNTLSYKPKTIITIHKSNSGLFDSNMVMAKIKDFADVVHIASNNTNYILGGE